MHPEWYRALLYISSLPAGAGVLPRGGGSFRFSPGLPGIFRLSNDPVFSPDIPENAEMIADP